MRERGGGWRESLRPSRNTYLGTATLKWMYWFPVRFEFKDLIPFPRRTRLSPGCVPIIREWSVELCVSVFTHFAAVHHRTSHTFRDFHFHMFAIQCRHPNRTSQRGVRNVHRNLDMHVVAITMEGWMACHLSGRASMKARGGQ
jgi:hypothetical protein